MWTYEDGKRYARQENVNSWEIAKMVIQLIGKGKSLSEIRCAYGVCAEAHSNGERPN